MHLFSSKKLHNKIISFFVSFLFLIESSFFPLATLLPRAASAETVAQVTPYSAVFNQDGVSGGTFVQNSWGVTHGTIVVSGGTVHNAVVQLTLPAGLYSPSVVSFTVNGIAQPLANLPLMQQLGNTYSWSFGDIVPQTAFLAVKFLTSASAQSATLSWNLLGTNMNPVSVSSSQAVTFLAVANVVISMAVFGPDGAAASTFAQNSFGYTSGTMTVSGGTMHNAIVSLTLPSGFIFPTPDQFIVNDIPQPVANLPAVQQSGNTYSWSFGDIVPQSATLRVRFTTTSQAQSGTINWGLTGTNAQASTFTQQQGVSVPSSVQNTPSLTLSGTSFPAGTPLTGTVTNAAPNAAVTVNCIDPNNASCSDVNAGTTNSTGGFSKTYATTGWVAGNYRVWVTVNGVNSNILQFSITAPASTPALSLSAASISQGSSFTGTVSGTPNAAVQIFCRNPQSASCDDPNPLTTGVNGTASRTYATGGWLIGMYQFWVTVNGVQSNIVSFTITAPSVSNNPVASVSPSSITQGGSFTSSITGAAPNALIRIFSRGPDGVTAEDTPGTTSSTGTFSRTYVTTGWTAGTYQGWVTVNGVQSNMVSFTVVATEIQSFTISRTPATSSVAPYKAGDQTTLLVSAPVSLFANDFTGIGYNQIDSNAATTLPFSTRTLVKNGLCSASTGQCSLPGNWDAASLACPAGVTGIHKMREWYSVDSYTSNVLTWYFQCSAVNPPPSQVSQIEIRPAAVSLAVGQTQVLALWVTPAGGTAQEVTSQTQWVSSKPAIVALGSPPDGTVNNTALGKAAGTATITATYQGQTVQATVTVGDASQSPGILPVGATAVYKGGGNIWAASRINQDTIIFNRWSDPLSSTDIVWRSDSKQGTIASESSSEIHYQPVMLYASGVPADPFGTSDGPYDIWLTPSGLSVAKQNQTKSFVGGRIGYGAIPAFYSRQWCGLGTICNKSLPEDLWDGWPLWGFALQKENGTDVDSIMMGPLWTGFEIIQTTLTRVGTSPYLFGQEVTPCSDWTTTIGLCKNGSLYAPGGGGVLKIKLGTQSHQWWYDGNQNLVIDCSDFGKPGARFPRDPVEPHGVAIALTDRNVPTRAESTWMVSQEGACAGSSSSSAYPALSVSPLTFHAGDVSAGTVTGGAPNAAVRIFHKGPEGINVQDASGTTDASGTFSFTYATASWSAGTYQAWVDVQNVQSNVPILTVQAAEVQTPSRPAPTPTTAPMATLTMERDQEQVTPDKLISFSGTLDASKVAFPQGSVLFIAIPEKTTVDRIEIDGSALGAGAFSQSGGSVKVPFLSNLYDNSHSFRIVLRNEVSSVPQLDRRVAIWVSVVDADGKLLLKGRTASTLIAHLPTEVIGKGISLTVPNTLYGTTCCWVSADKTHFPIRNFSFGETDITRGPFFTPNLIPLLPENIAFTMFPSDASMQRIGMSLKQFSDPLAREFITAEYQYLFGRDPSFDEISRYLPAFTQWRNPLANLAEAYNRRADVQQAVLVPRDKNIGGANSGSPLPSWDKLLEWAGTKGWQEEPSLASFKLQSGFDDGWKLFKELWTEYAPLVSLDNPYRENYNDYFVGDAMKNPVSAIAYLCNTSNLNRGHYPARFEDGIDFEFCWKNDPMLRHAAILWAKDAGWAYNTVVTDETAISAEGALYPVPVVKIIDPSGPVLASMFAPGKYPEYAQESAMRYPPAQLYYDLISSPEYAQSVEQRFRKNIDSIDRLFFGRPATEGDIAWAKDKFISGGVDKSLGYNRFYSWITPQWEPNGLLIASNFQYVDEIEFVKHPRYITDDVYGIRHIQGEVDAVSSRLIEMTEKYDRQELRQGDNFKRIVSGLYRLYMRRTPADAEIDAQRGKEFGDIEFFLNQSREYGKDPASDAAIKNLYRNYLGRDPSDSDIAQWGDKTISTIANKIGMSPEMKSYAQQHPENAYVFPVKRIKIVKCGFFCSILSKIISAIPIVGIVYSTVVQFATGHDVLLSSPGEKSIHDLLNITLNSISFGFNQAGFNGETFVSHVSIARSMAGQAGGVFSMTNLFENADPTILDGFRTMAKKDGSDTRLAEASGGFSYATNGFASLLSAFTGTDKPRVDLPEQPRLAQIDISDHYGGGVVGTQAPLKNSGSKTTAASAVSFSRTLTKGSRGTDVLRLQKILGESDLTFLPQYQTGAYGPKTEAAVKRFQKRSGLPQTGMVGPKTRALLNLYGK